MPPVPSLALFVMYILASKVFIITLLSYLLYQKNATQIYTVHWILLLYKTYREMYNYKLFICIFILITCGMLTFMLNYILYGFAKKVKLIK
jgi:hypothetical protein